MIDFQHLIKGVEDDLNASLNEMEGTEYSYKVNDTPKNYRYHFNFQTDAGEMQHAELSYAQGTYHHNKDVYLNGIATVNPVTLDGVNTQSYNALVDTVITFDLPLYQVKNKRLFLTEFRRLVDTTLQSSANYFDYDEAGTVYQIGTQHELMQTGNVSNASSMGYGIQFVLSITWSIVTQGISSDKIELTVGGERIYFQHFGMARKVVKELAELSSDVSANKPMPPQKSFITGTLLTITFDLPSRFSTNGQNSSFNAKVADFTLGNKSESFTVTVKYPKTQTTSGSPKTTNITYEEQSFTMKFDTVGVNATTGLVSSQSITLVEV